MNNKLLTPKDISKILNIGYRNVLDMIQKGQIQAIKIGNLYRVSEINLQKFINDNILK